MARKANETTNSPDSEDVKAAVRNIEERFADLASERGVYMQKCKRIREGMANDYDTAGNRGISKKLLKTIVKERELERRIAALSNELEIDEQSERDMLIEKLGDFINTPLGGAAVARADGGSTLAGVGA